MATLDEDRINDKLRGSLAELIFELLHGELGCFVFRTGQEYLYKHLFEFANLKKSIQHTRYSTIDMKNIMEIWGHTQLSESVLNKDNAIKTIKQLRFKHSQLAQRLSSSPDFTIITPAGNIHQFEVKYRYDGRLTEDENKKYLKHHKYAFLFIVMSTEPYIKILGPRHNHGDVESVAKWVVHEYRDILWKKAAAIVAETLKTTSEELVKRALEGDIPIEMDNAIQQLERNEEIRNQVIDTALERFEESHVPTSFYVELEEDDGSIRLESDETTLLWKDVLVYQTNKLNKYKSIVKEWFSLH